MRKITIGNYLLERLSEIGIRDIFGVPGDFNLGFLDDIIKNENLNWIGCTNELNASYSVDGYARVNGIGAILTTYGVGELSAVNGIAGSYSEDVPIIHIVGTPKREYFKRHMILHHSLGTSDSFGAYKKIYENITSLTVWLDAKNAINQINNAIKYAVFYKKPVYIMIPQDVAGFEIMADTDLLSFASGFDLEEHKEIIEDVKNKINKSHQAVVISGHKVIRYGLKSDLEKFVNRNGINVVTTGFGKGSVDETNELYLGVYSGLKTPDAAIAKIIDTADLVLIIGNKFTDLTSSFFQLNFNKDNVVEISDTHVKYDNKIFTNHSFGFLVKMLANDTNINYKGLSVLENRVAVEFNPTEEKITYNRLQIALNNYFVEKDILVSDVGTCTFLSQYIQLKKDMKFIMQPLWASIGFSFPASIGAQIASNSKVVNILGDGAFNMVFNELITVINKQIPITTILLNNNGYTIEKVIHGDGKPYNELPKVNYSQLIKAFDPEGEKSISLRVTNEIELQEALVISRNSNKFVFIEVCLEQNDIPEALKGFFNK